MQIQMAYIRTDEGGTGVADLCVHVRAIHIYKSTVVMDDLTHLADSCLEDAMGGWIRDHTTGQTITMLLGFLSPLSEIGISLFIALDHYRLKACLYAAGGVRAMGGCGDEQHLTLGCMLSMIATEMVTTGIMVEIIPVPIPLMITVAAPVCDDSAMACVGL